jgi:glycosyltransferase involved in cell wall biosynthesis
VGARNPIVSVVIPIFNGAPFVAKAVESILAQDVTGVEIIVVDDGSTDGTQTVLAELATTAGIVWFQQDHGGPARSRNRGISEASGEFIALLDCDDVWLPGKLEAQLAIMRARPAVGVVHTDYEVVDEQGRVEERARARYSQEPLVLAFAGGHTALPSTLLIRRSVLDQVGALDPDLYGSEDSDLTIRLYAVTEFECVDQVLVRKLQRGHGYRDMAFDETTHRKKILASRRRFLERLDQRPTLTSEQRTALNREWANFFLLSGLVAERCAQPAEARQQYLQAIRKAPFRLRGYTRLLRVLRS